MLYGFRKILLSETQQQTYSAKCKESMCQKQIFQISNAFRLISFRHYSIVSHLSDQVGHQYYLTTSRKYGQFQCVIIHVNVLPNGCEFKFHLFVSAHVCASLDCQLHLYKTHPGMKWLKVEIRLVTITKRIYLFI